MGIRIHRNTWRAPLQLIDCWLPMPAANKAPADLPALAQRFVRAGWLGRPATEQPADDKRMLPDSESQLPGSRAPYRGRTSLGTRADARVILSGRMSDVCAELERLAAQEMRWQPAPH